MILKRGKPLGTLEQNEVSTEKTDKIFSSAATKVKKMQDNTKNIALILKK